MIKCSALYALLFAGLCSTAASAQQAALRKETVEYWFYEDKKAGIDFLGYTAVAQGGDELLLGDCRNKSAPPRKFKRSEVWSHPGPCHRDPNVGLYAYILDGKITATQDQTVSIDFPTKTGSQTLRVAKDWLQQFGTIPKVGDSVVFVPTWPLIGKSESDVSAAFKDFKPEFAKPIGSMKTNPAFNIQALGK